MAANAFGTLFSGLQTPADTFKTNILSGYGANMSTNAGPKIGGVGPITTVNPKAAYTSSLVSSTAKPATSGGGSQAPVTPPGGNASATAPATPKSTFVDSQVNTPSTATPTPSNSTAPTTPVNPDYNLQFPGAGATPPGNVDTTSPQYQYNQAFQTYLQSLQPSQAETDAEKALADQTLQASKDQETALTRPGETSGFASGEAARVAHNNAFQTDALSNTVNALTGARTARTTAAQAGLDFEKSQQPDNSSFNLPAGETRYDSKGNVIATAPAAPAAPKVIGDSTSGYYTVGNDGTLTPLLGASPKSLTDAQTKQNAYGQINQLLGMTDSKGVPYVDNNGFFTPEGFKSIVENAAEDGLTRADIIAQYGNLIYGPSASKYGLTPKEISDLGL